MILRIFIAAICGTLAFVRPCHAEWQGPGHYTSQGTLNSNPRTLGYYILSQSEYNSSFASNRNAGPRAVPLTAAGLAALKPLAFMFAVAGVATYAIDCATNDWQCIDTAVAEAGGWNAVMSGGSSGPLLGRSTVSCKLRKHALQDACLNAISSIDTGISGYFSNYTCGEIIEDGRYGEFVQAFDACMAEVAGCVNRTLAIAANQPLECEPGLDRALVVDFENLAIE